MGPLQSSELEERLKKIQKNIEGWRSEKKEAEDTEYERNYHKCREEPAEI
jgi:hypothetical protein